MAAKLWWSCAKLTNSLKVTFIPSKGEINSYHEEAITTLHMKNSCMNEQGVSKWFTIIIIIGGL